MFVTCGNKRRSIRPRAWHGRVQFVKMEHDDIKVDARDYIHQTPLLLYVREAAEGGHAEATATLLQRNGVGINSQDNLQNTPLCCAARARQT